MGVILWMTTYKVFFVCAAASILDGRYNKKPTPLVTPSQDNEVSHMD